MLLHISWHVSGASRPLSFEINRMARVNGITQFLTATHTSILILLRKHSPDGTTWTRQHTSDTAYYSIYRPRKDEMLSWSSWLTYSGRLTHISGHPSAACWAWDRESSPVKDNVLTTVPRNQVPNHPNCNLRATPVWYVVMAPERGFSWQRIKLLPEQTFCRSFAATCPLYNNCYTSAKPGSYGLICQWMWKSRRVLAIIVCVLIWPLWTVVKLCGWTKSAVSGCLLSFVKSAELQLWLNQKVPSIVHSMRKVGRLALVDVVIELFKTKCMPIPLYGFLFRCLSS